MGNLMSEFFNELASQSGIDTQSEDYLNFIQDKKLSEISVPENIAKSFQTSLLTKHSAKNDKDVAGHFKVKYYKTIENGLNRSLKGFGVPDDLISELEQEPDTLKRIEIAIPKIADYIKSSNPVSDEGGTKYKSLLNTYNETLKKLQETESTWTEKEKQWSQDLENREIGWEINNLLSAYNYTDSIPADDAKFLITRKIQESPYIFKKDNGKLGVFQKENPDLIAQEKNRALSVKDVVDQFAAPYLKKANAQQSQQSSQGSFIVQSDKKLNGSKASTAINKNAQALEFLNTKRG